MEVIVVFAVDMVVAVVSGLLVTKEPEVEAEDFIINIPIYSMNIIHTSLCNVIYMKISKKYFFVDDCY